MIFTDSQISALCQLYPNTFEVTDGLVKDKDGNAVQYDADAVVDLAAKNDCKAEAKQRLADTDWSVLPDVVVKNKLEFETYRSQIRALVLNPVAEPTWPTEPQPIWS